MNKHMVFSIRSYCANSNKWDVSLLYMLVQMKFILIFTMILLVAFGILPAASRNVNGLPIGSAGLPVTTGSFNLGTTNIDLAQLRNSLGETQLQNSIGLPLLPNNVVLNQLPVSVGGPEVQITAATFSDANGNSVSVNNLTSINSRFLTFQFTGSVVNSGDPPVNRFACSIDGSQFQSCVSPFQVGPVQIGLTHVFTIQAVNTQNEAGPPVRFFWFAGSNVNNELANLNQNRFSAETEAANTNLGNLNQEQQNQGEKLAASNELKGLEDRARFSAETLAAN